MSLNPKYAPWVFALIAVAVLGMGWHGRSRPPKLPTFRPPVVDTQPAEEPQVLAEDVEASLPEAPPPPPPEDAPPPKVEVAPPAPPQKAPETPAPAGPSILGKWKVVDMSVNGQSPPGMDQMTMTFAFKEDGTAIAVHEVPSARMRKKQTGTYEISGSQITVHMEGHDQTMSFSFEGNDRLVLSFEQMRMVLERAL